MAFAGLDDRTFARLSEYIESEVGIKMPPAKRIMLESRLQKRLRALEIPDFEAYVDHVFNASDGETEIVHMIDAVTTNKTDFFREADHFTFMTERALPDIARWSDQLKVWSSASSTGEEPYTLAIVLAEWARDHRQTRWRILGTDISTRVLETARRAVYPTDRVAPVAPELRKRYFLRSRDAAADVVRVRPELRRNVLYARLNLMDDEWAIRDRFHIIFCRNVLIYFDRPRQQRLVSRLYDHLLPGGYLFLGHSETMAGMGLNMRSVAPTVYFREASDV